MLSWLLAAEFRAVDMDVNVMKLVLTLTPAFSEDLFTWHATLPIGARGALRSSWGLGAVHREIRDDRWSHGLAEDSLWDVRELMAALPEHCGQQMDDAGEQVIQLLDQHGSLQRTRNCWPGAADANAIQFDALWARLAEARSPKPANLR